MGPRLDVAAGHDRRAFERALFTARHAGADEAQAFLGQILRAADGVREIAVATVDDYVAGFHKR